MLKGLLNGIVNNRKSKNVDLKVLPSRGLFYFDDFKIRIRKASEEDIVNYKTNYTNDFLEILSLIKIIVKKNTTISKDYDFFDVSSIDIMYLFFEIIKYTNGDDMLIYYPKGNVVFNSSNFNYFELTDEIMSYYDDKGKNFNIKGFKYKLPSIGIEHSTTMFINESAEKGTISKFKDKNYDFMYFMGDKNHLLYDEIINLITIFNDELDNEDIETVSYIMGLFEGINKYELLTPDGNIVEMNSIDLSKVWD